MCIHDQLKKGKRDPKYGNQLTEEEHANLKKLEFNIQSASIFVFKGTKEADPVGDLNLDMYNRNISGKQQKLLKQNEEKTAAI